LVVRGAIVPHAPLLTRPVTREGAAEIARVLDAVGEVRFDDVDVLCVLSSHGDATGVYARGHASLRGLGLEGPGFEIEMATAAAEQLGRAWGEPRLDSDPDHGVVVPLALTRARLPVAAAAIAEDADTRDAIGRGRAFARALSAAKGRVGFVASANTAAALTARAPLGLRAEAADVDRRLIAYLADGTGDGDSILHDLVRVGGSCGAGPLSAFAELFTGRAHVRAYEAPFGIGYLVATAEP
jgi:hypothetical protein